MKFLLIILIVNWVVRLVLRREETPEDEPEEVDRNTVHPSEVGMR